MHKETKIALRKQISDEIQALPDDYITASNEGLFLQIASLEEFTAARNIFLYYSVKREPATQKIAKAALSMGKTVAFPYCLKGGIMHARVVRSLDELSPAMLGIPAASESAPVIAPGELEIVIVPALTYDMNGYRLGYGGGYYDRYLHGIPALTLGLARERLIRDELPIEPHDIPVKRIVTERGVLRATA